jgi:SAM-dependent methyltransferase
VNVIWHELECGRYRADLPVWRSLAAASGGAILDVGAGTGRVTLELARRGHHVTALERDPELLAELSHRVRGLEVEPILGDARDFDLGRMFALCIVPMQTIQLLGPRGREAFLNCARRHLRPDGVLALAITGKLELFDVSSGAVPPVADVCERDGVLYSSQATAIRRDGATFVLERIRQAGRGRGVQALERNVIRLDVLSASELRDEAEQAGFAAAGRREIPPTRDHAGSEVVMLRG